MLLASSNRISSCMIQWTSWWTCSGLQSTSDEEVRSGAEKQSRRRESMLTRSALDNQLHLRHVFGHIVFDLGVVFQLEEDIF